MGPHYVVLVYHTDFIVLSQIIVSKNIAVSDIKRNVGNMRSEHMQGDFTFAHTQACKLIHAHTLTHNKTPWVNVYKSHHAH